MEQFIGGLSIITVCHIMEQIWPKTGNSFEMFVISVLFIFFFLILQTNSIIEQEKINYLQNTKEELVSVAWENIVSDHGSVTT